MSIIWAWFVDNLMDSHADMEIRVLQHFNTNRLHRYSLRPSLVCSIIRWSIKYTDTLKSIHKDDNLETFGKLPRHDLAALFVIN